MARPRHLPRRDAGREDSLHRSVDRRQSMCPESEEKRQESRRSALHPRPWRSYGDAVDVGKKLNPVAVGIYELCLWLQKKGVKQIAPMKQGGTQTVAGVKITMVHAVPFLRHSGWRPDRLRRRSLRLRARVLQWSQALSRGGHRRLQRHGHHSRSLRSENRHAADRRSFHDVAARGCYACKRCNPKPSFRCTLVRSAADGTPSELQKLVPDVEVLALKPDRQFS